MTWNASSIGRLVAIGLAGGILQLTTVSQIAVFGVPADLSPLLVAAIGLLCGSIAGASFGFGLGLFMDTLLAQTLGVTSLVLLTAAMPPAACASCATRLTASCPWPSARRPRR